MNGPALSVACAYHDHWTNGRFERAAALFAPDLRVEVPVNAYPTPDSFAQALTRFGALARGVTLLSALGADDEAMLRYDMHVQGLGAFRVAEHFAIAEGRITRLRQIHDTHQLRTAGFVPN